MKVRPSVRPRDKGALVHLVDVDDPALTALCGRPGPWTAAELPMPKKCDDCATAYQMRTNHVGGRAWIGR